MICVVDVDVELINDVGFIGKVFRYEKMRSVVKGFMGSERKMRERMINL